MSSIPYIFVFQPLPDMQPDVYLISHGAVYSVPSTQDMKTYQDKAYKDFST